MTLATPWSVIALTLCPAWTEDDNKQVTISGLFEIEDRVLPDRTCGQTESGYWIFRKDDPNTPEAEMFFVDDYTLLQQVNPKAYGQTLLADREAEWVEEDRDEQEYIWNSQQPAGGVDPR